MLAHQSFRKIRIAPFERFENFKVLFNRTLGSTILKNRFMADRPRVDEQRLGSFMHAGDGRTKRFVHFRSKRNIRFDRRHRKRDTVRYGRLYVLGNYGSRTTPNI